MKLVVLGLLLAVAAVELRGVQPAPAAAVPRSPGRPQERVDGWGFSSFRADAETVVPATGENVADQAVTAVQHAKGPVADASTDEILAEIKHRVEVCGESGSPLAGLSLDDLFAELKRREAAKVCESPGAPAPAVAPAPPAPAENALAEETVVTTTTTTTSTLPCPDNFMDEIVDQANPEFDRFDANQDGCLEDGELTAHLRKQIEIARHRDYYWIRRNITDAARDLIKQGKQVHAGADENDSGCLNKEELDVIHHAICDCPTQFMFMDHNADGKISMQEASTFVSDHMTHADINYVTLKKIFKAADVDGNKFLVQKEFCDAGSKYQGDGPEVFKHWLPAPAPAPAPAF